MLDYGNFMSGALRSSEHPTLSALGKKLQLVPDNDIGFQQVSWRVAYLDPKDRFSLLY